jgi:phenylacetate-CoA ligase
MEYERIRQRHVAHLVGILPDYLARLGWSATELAAERQARLRELLAVAIARSPWHRDRLGGIDPSRIGEDDLPRLPTMTKADLMDHWDDIVTDRRLTLEQARGHVAGLASDAYLHDELHVVASGGSSGRQGIYAYGWEPWALAFLGPTRMMLRDRATSPELDGLPNTLAMVAAGRATHMTAAMTQTFANPQFQARRFPVTLPMAEIVAGLNEFQPVKLGGYPSALVPLAAEARAGRLRIAPKRLMSTSEPLTADARRTIEETFGAPVANTWGISEAGAMATGCWRGDGMHLCDDLVIVEPVDRDGRPVPAGTCSDKILVTAIANPTLPLIRYEITDQMTILTEPCPCGLAHRRVGDVEGRLDDAFTYAGGVTVHPHVFRSALLGQTGVVEYQVRQTARGADILAIGSLDDPPATERALEATLASLGVATPAVSLRGVDTLERQAIGKLRRFVPLEGAS